VTSLYIDVNRAKRSLRYNALQVLRDPASRIAGFRHE